MKKVLSVLLAAAMVMGMSVSAFAADVTFGAGDAATQHALDVKANLEINEVWHEGVWYTSAQEVANLEAGDDLYFKV